tara:strand:+ start:679 stop:828 length:150 start_codon:yes stop_codon:yes gene_type:complete
MNNDIKEVIKVIKAKVSKDSKSEDDLRFTQAALNLAHVAAVLKEVDNKQ